MASSFSPELTMSNEPSLEERFESRLTKSNYAVGQLFSIRLFSVAVLLLQSTKKEPIRIFAEKVRDHKDFDSRWAVLEVGSLFQPACRTGSISTSVTRHV